MVGIVEFYPECHFWGIQQSLQEPEKDKGSAAHAPEVLPETKRYSASPRFTYRWFVALFRTPSKFRV